MGIVRPADQGGVLLVSNMTEPKPSISIAYGKFQMEVGSDDDSNSSHYYSDDTFDDSHIVVQRVHLNKHENDPPIIAHTRRKSLCWSSFCDSFDDLKFEET